VRAHGSLFAGAALVLALELLELRIFSYALDPQLVYSAISAALLGLSAGAMIGVRWPALLRSPELEARCFAAFSLATLACLALFARLSPAAGFGPGAGLLFASQLPPYLALGLLLAAVTAREGTNLGHAYLANLAGSALGAALVAPLLRPLGAERLLALIAAVGAAAALARAASPRGRLLPSLALLASLLAFPFAPSLFPFQPDPRDLYGVAREALARAHIQGEPRQEFSRWDPVSRVEIYSLPGPFGLVDERAPFKLFVQDGGAGSMLVGRDHETRQRLFEHTVYGGAYLLRPAPERVLIVGLGGAPDVLAALHHQARSITGVELNATAIEVVRDRFAEFLGHPYQQPGVTVHHADGRSFLDRATERYDVIQMTGADTYAAGSGGAFMFTENYLYTSEAFRRYIQALAPGGVLSITRFGLEPLRVVTTELQALRSLGVADPRRHLAVIAQGIWVNVLLFRDPLPDDEAARLALAVEQRAALPRPRIPAYEALSFGLEKPMELLYAPGSSRSNPYSALIQAGTPSGERAALAPLGLDFSPVPDDRPFFFQHLTAARLGALLGSGASEDYYLRGLRSHLGFLLAVGALGALLTLGPLRGKRPRGALLYFGALGLGYLFVELSVLQKGALFLGHPTYSATLTLLALLLGSGAGAAWSQRSATPGRIARGAAAALVPCLLVLHPALRLLFGALMQLPLGVRAVALAVPLGALGFLMGVPFPSGLRELRAQGEEAVAWAIGVNAFASVLGSLVAVPIAMFSGFEVVGALAAVLYGLAALRSIRLGEPAS
jgi:SAM-dependent methyltransferase